jgi:hypothetical protein
MSGTSVEQERRGLGRSPTARRLLDVMSNSRHGKATMVQRIR